MFCDILYLKKKKEANPKICTSITQSYVCGFKRKMLRESGMLS